MGHPNEAFIISHTLKAPRAVVFSMWINPELYRQWLGPTNSEMKFIKANIKEGGVSHWSMKTDDGQTKYGKIYHKIINPNRMIVYTQHFADRAGNMAPIPGKIPYPEELLTTVSFVEVDPSTTKLIVKWEPYSEATQSELEMFRKLQPVMTTGWTQSFEKMESLIKDLSSR